MSARWWSRGYRKTGSPCSTAVGRSTSLVTVGSLSLESSLRLSCLRLVHNCASWLRPLSRWHRVAKLLSLIFMHENRSKNSFDYIESQLQILIFGQMASVHCCVAHV